MPFNTAMDRTILHCDNDAFYSTTEEMLNPKLRGKAHAVAGSVEDRNGIILAKSYVAKKFGVKTGEAIWQAKQKCPDLITMPPNYEMYLNTPNWRIRFILSTRISYNHSVWMKHGWI